jgi:transposase
MSLRPQPLTAVPDDTARVARAAFPHGNTYLALRDQLGTLFGDDDFAALYPRRGRPAEAPWRLALITVFQFVENLSDRQAADAVRARIDWKYALALELTDPGFDSSVLCEFRARLLAGSAEQRLLDAILDRCRERGWLKARGRQRTDSTHVLGRIRALNRLLCAQEALRHALNVLAVAAPEWLLANSQAAWLERYGRRCDESRVPAGQEQRRAFAQRVGEDGRALLAAVDAPGAPAWLRDMPAVVTLRLVWLQQFYQEGDAVRWRTEAEGTPPSSLSISSPYDPEARYARKETTTWVGYKVHLTESCDDDAPHLITHVETTPAPVADGDMTPVIHEGLQAKGLLPGKHLADTGYVDAELFVQSRQQYQVDLVGPTRADYHWQARAGQGFAADNFRVDWEQGRMTCPEGKLSIGWSPAVDKGHNHVIKVKFSAKDCGACPSKEQCTRGTRRLVTIRPREQYEALGLARLREGTAEYQRDYGKRAGVEGTISQGVRVCGLRRSRYAGQAKAHLQHLATAAALNVLRIGDWLDQEPRAQTRTSAFAQLMAPLATAA